MAKQLGPEHYGHQLALLRKEIERLEDALPEPYRLRALRDYILEIRGEDANPLVLEDIERWGKQARAVLEDHGDT